MTKCTRKILLIAALALLLVATCVLAACDILGGLFGGGGECTHEFGEWHEGTPATCFGSGQKGYYTCKKCGKNFERDGVTEINDFYIHIDPNAHQMTHHPEVPATCRGWGTKEYYECKMCGQLFTDEYGQHVTWESELEIEPLGNHSMTFVDGVEPTCTTDGIREHWHCSKCDGNFEDENGYYEIYNVVRPKQHSVTTVYANSPSCTSDGNVKYYHCTACGNNLSDYDCTTEISDADIVVAATGHSIAHVAAVENTHDTDGNVEHWHCDNCNKNFADEEATTQIDATIPKGHNWGDDGICKECDQEEYSAGLKFTLQNDNTYKVSKGTFNGRELIIPSMYEGKEVTAIAENGFKDCSALETVSLSSTVTEIVKNAFDGCENMTAVYYNGAIASWIKLAFANEKSNPLYYGHNLYTFDAEQSEYQLLTELVLQEYNTNRDYSYIPSVNAYAFINCTSLTKVTINGTVDNCQFANKSFDGCTELIGVYLKVNISNWASINFANETANPLYYAHKLYAWQLGLSTEAHYEEVTDLYVGYNFSQSKMDELETITAYAFVNCTTLLDAAIPKDTGNSALQGCTSLQTITLPWTFNLGKYFGGDIPSSLKTVYFSDKNDADNWYSTITYPTTWSNIEKIVFPEGITSLSQQHNLNNLTSLKTLVLSEGSTSLKQYDFENLTSLETLVLPESLTSLGKHDFNNLTSLETLVLPENLQNLNAEMFKGCSEVLFNEYEDGLYLGTKTNKYKFLVKPTSTDATSFTIHKDCERVALHALDDCSQIEILYTPIVIDISGLKELHFNNADRLYVSIDIKTLTKLSLPANVTEVYIDGCSSLESLTIPDTATSVSIKNCNIKELTIPATVVTSVPYSVKDLTIHVIDTHDRLPKNTDIPSEALKGHTNLECVRLGGIASGQEDENDIGTMSIGSGAFSGCTSLNEIWIFEKVTSIGADAFSGCENLQKVRYFGITDKKKIDQWVEIEFGNETANPLYYGDLYINGKLVTEANLTTATKVGTYAFANYSKLASVTIGDSVISIGESAFNGCRALADLTIGNGVTTIGSYAFDSCDGLSVNYLGTIDQWAQIEFDNEKANPLYNGGQLYIDNEAATEVNLTTATKISNYAFVNYTALTDVTIGNSVARISASAFNGCSGLTKLTIDSNEIDTTKIYELTLSSCSNLTNLEFGNNVTNIGNAAFYNCSSLTSVIIPNSVASIGFNAFKDCPNLTTVTFSENSQLMSIFQMAFYNCSSLASIEIPSSVTCVDSNAFWNCESLTSLTINSKAVAAGTRIYEKFYGCKNIADLKFGDDVTSIGAEAFQSTKLTNVTIGNNVTNIGDRAFQSATLKNITISNSVTSIGEYAFQSCTAQTKVNYLGTIDQWAQIEFANATANPLSKRGNLYINGVLVTEEIKLTTATKIAAYAFYYFKDLTSIVIPSSVICVGREAFTNSNCNPQVNYLGTIDQWAQIEFANKNANPLNCGTNLYINDVLVTEVKLTTATKINTYAFQNYENLTSIEISSSVTSIDEEAFSGCCNIENITVAGGNTIYHSSGNCLIATETKALIAGCKNSIIPQDGSVTSICDYAFGGCIGLTSIEIPASVTSIGYGAFTDCYNLTSVTFAENSQLESIDAVAFNNCRNLTSIVIPASVTSIERNVFSLCDNLTIYCEATSKPSGWNTRWNSSNCTVVWGYTGD